jgi:hypothetical protein
VGGIFRDPEKVFDCVSYDILLPKLKLYGTAGRNNVLYKSFLSDRYQKY